MYREVKSILTKDDLKNYKNSLERLYQQLHLEIITKIADHCRKPVPGKYLLVESPTKIYLRGITERDIYHLLSEEKIFGRIVRQSKLHSCHWTYYLYLEIYDSDKIKAKIMKDIKRRQTSQMTQFKYVKYYFYLCVPPENKIMADYHNYKLALQPYGYKVELDGHYNEGIMITLE